MRARQALVTSVLLLAVAVAAPASDTNWRVTLRASNTDGQYGATTFIGWYDGYTNGVDEENEPTSLPWPPYNGVAAYCPAVMDVGGTLTPSTKDFRTPLSQGQPLQDINWSFVVFWAINGITTRTIDPVRVTITQTEDHYNYSFGPLSVSVRDSIEYGAGWKRLLFTAQNPLTSLTVSFAEPNPNSYLMADPDIRIRAGLALRLDSVSPTAGANSQSAVPLTVVGVGFMPGISVCLRRSGYADITAADVTVESPNQLTCTANLLGAEPGAWALAATNPDGEYTECSAPFTISAPPVVQITSPTSADRFATPGAFVDIGGTATDDIAVWRVSWSSDHGSSGVCNGTGTWSAYGIDLQPGMNTITVTAMDVTGNISSDQLMVRSGPMTIGEARTWPPGIQVQIEDAVVTAVGPEPGVVFVQSSDRSAAIRLQTDQPLDVGDHVSFTGVRDRLDGEQAIADVFFGFGAPGDALAPLGMNTRAIGNDVFESLSYTGLDITGLLVRVCGKVTGTLPAESAFYLNDGYGFSDGVGGLTGIRIHTPSGIALPAVGGKVMVTGIVRVQQLTLSGGNQVNGLWYAPGTTVYIPSVWLRGSGDLIVLP